jgi:hypothetical protein
MSATARVRKAVDWSGGVDVRVDSTGVFRIVPFLVAETVAA